MFTNGVDWKTPVRYLGMDTRRKNTTLTSFHVSQGSYVGELLKGYPVEARSSKLNV